MLSLEGKDEPTPFIRTPFTESGPAFSPDGRWVAYESNESGGTEVYVREFPGAGGKTRVSIDGGIEPQWSRDGKELYFLSGGKMMAADLVDGGEEARFGKPHTLFDAHYERHWIGPNFDTATDGRFLMVKTPPELAPRQISVVLNWYEELERLVPAE